MGGDQQIFESTAQADPQLTVVRVNGGQLARIIRVDGDGVFGDRECPWLGVVPARGQRRSADEFPHGDGHAGILFHRSSGLAGFLVVIEPWRILEQHISAGCGDASNREEFQEITTA